MFTGIVEIIGTVEKLERLDKSASGGNGVSLTIKDAREILGDCHDGDSIAVNGTCLTVTEFNGDTFKIGIAPETLRRTNLGNLREGSKVNLERAVSASTRMGGHFVQGHVDTIADIISVTPDGNAKTFRFQPRDQRVLQHIVEKGFITIDGASLTVTKVDDGPQGWWEVMLIAYTQERVVTANKKKGDTINVEVDVVGKYVEKQVHGYLSSTSAGNSAVLEKMVDKILTQKLKAKL